MRTLDWLQIALYVVGLGLAAQPLGLAIARVLQGQLPWSLRCLQPVEQGLYRLAGVHPEQEMSARQYSAAVLVFSVMSIVVVYGMQRWQAVLPLNPQHLPAVAADSAFNTAVSFVTNTNWQGYAGESTMSPLTQMAALTVQNFLSAAAGMAVLLALIRGFTRQETPLLGNFWVDLVRSTLYLLLPLSTLLAIALLSQGVVQTFQTGHVVPLLDPTIDAQGQLVTTQSIAVGPVASQIAIKQLGTNGGGYFNANSAHPFENPTPLTNLLELWAILLIPAASCLTFGELVGDRRQGWALLWTMALLAGSLLLVSLWAETNPPRLLPNTSIDQSATPLQPGGNLEGKELRLGVAISALWSVATTAASNGSVNSMHDSFTPLGGLIALWLIQLGEVVFGGVGAGLYGMVVFAIVAVFIAGLMVGRTPEYLGKKIGAFEMQMASLVILLPCATVLIGTACAITNPAGQAGISNPGPHGFSQVLYAFSSAGNNNGSAFAGLGANTPFYNWSLAIAMLIGRFGVIFPVLAIAGSLATKKRIPVSSGTLPTHTPLFVVLLTAVIVVIGALSFFPALALGPIVEHFLMLTN